MPAKCHIRNSRARIPAQSGHPKPEFVSLDLRFLTDSKTLSPISSPVACTPHLIGWERAFRGVPTNVKVFHPEAARRDQ